MYTGPWGVRVEDTVVVGQEGPTVLTNYPRFLMAGPAGHAKRAAEVRPGVHAHTMILGGLSMLLFAVVYALIPLLTKLEIRSQRLVNYHFWGWLVGAMMMTY